MVGRFGYKVPQETRIKCNRPGRHIRTQLYAQELSPHRHTNTPTTERALVLVVAIKVAIVFAIIPFKPKIKLIEEFRVRVKVHLACALADLEAAEAHNARPAVLRETLRRVLYEVVDDGMCRSFRQ